MNLNVRVDHYFHPSEESVELGRQLSTLITQGKELMATQAELVAQVTAVNEKLGKIGTETTNLLTKIDLLTQAVIDAGNVTPELQAAMDALTTQADVIDNLVADPTQGRRSRAGDRRP